MKVTGDLRKMGSSLDMHGKVHYTFRLKDREAIPLNPWVGAVVKMRFTGAIHCVSCGRTIRKTYGDGYCYDCFSSVPQTAPCIIRPELCEAHLGKGRDVEWERANHLQPHVVYLAETSAVKVGVTRKTQVPVRWIDQGAKAAIRFGETPNRKIAGDMEVYLKQFLSDKTDWRKLLRGADVEESLLLENKSRLAEFLTDDLKKFVSPQDSPVPIYYPVDHYPSEAKSITLDKVPCISSALAGVRGQYWLLDEGFALNIRRHAGYEVEVEVQA